MLQYLLNIPKGLGRMNQICNLPIPRGSIVVFEKDNCEKISWPTLFLQFLQWQRVKKPIRFSLVEKDARSLGRLSPKEDLFFHTLSTDFQDGEEAFKNILRSYGNIYLDQLYKAFSSLDRMWPETLSKSQQEIEKLASIIKGFLQKSDYLFLEKPEVHLNKRHVSLLIKAALAQENLRPTKTIFVVSSEKSLWKNYASHSIFRYVDGRFVLEELDRLGHLKILDSAKDRAEESTPDSQVDNFSKRLGLA